jgi:hypothetical protein
VSTDPVTADQAREMVALFLDICRRPGEHLADLEYPDWREWMRFLVPMMVRERQGELLDLIEARARRAVREGRTTDLSGVAYSVFRLLLEETGLELALKAREDQGS